MSEFNCNDCGCSVSADDETCPNCSNDVSFECGAENSQEFWECSCGCEPGDHLDTCPECGCERG